MQEPCIKKRNTCKFLKITKSQIGEILDVSKKPKFSIESSIGIPLDHLRIEIDLFSLNFGIPFKG